jgi:hypothetical protein
VAVHVYAGPTLAAARILSVVPGAVMHGPVQHGDLMGAKLGPGDCIVLIDGYYHQVGAVRHKEILHALDAGAAVIGAASMGAIRAAEMCGLGMTGIGEVYRQYRDGEISSDDEVAVAHEEGPEFRRVSEALVNIRFALTCARSDDVVGSDDADRLLHHARALPYSERSWAAIEHLVRQRDPILASAAIRIRAYAQANAAKVDLKAIDAHKALCYVASGQWRSSRDELDWREPRTWHTRHLHDWQVQYGSQIADDPFVPDLAVARYLQLHDPGFPSRWRAFALGRIAGANVGNLDRAALRAAAARGLSAGDLSARTISFWLTAEESRTLSQSQSLLAILVRSYRSHRGLRDVVDAAAVTTADPAIRNLVAEHYATNAAIVAKFPHWQLSHLNCGFLAAQLSSIWGAEASDQSILDACARDRGFSSFDSAVDSFRPFFLRGYLGQAELARARP